MVIKHSWASTTASQQSQLSLYYSTITLQPPIRQSKELKCPLPTLHLKIKPQSLTINAQIANNYARFYRCKLRDNSFKLVTVLEQIKRHRILGFYCFAFIA